MFIASRVRKTTIGELLNMKPRYVESLYYISYLDKEEEDRRKLEEKKKDYKKYQKAKQDEQFRQNILARGGRMPAKLRNDLDQKPVDFKDFNLTAQDLEDLADEFE